MGAAQPRARRRRGGAVAAGILRLSLAWISCRASIHLRDPRIGCDQHEPSRGGRGGPLSRRVSPSEWPRASRRSDPQPRKFSSSPLLVRRIAEDTIVGIVHQIRSTARDVAMTTAQVPALSPGVQPPNGTPRPNNRASVPNHAQGAKSNLVPRSDKDKLAVWTMLFAILGVLVAILTVGFVWLLIIKQLQEAVVLLAPISAIITGMFGLFATSPTSPTP